MKVERIIISIILYFFTQASLLSCAPAVEIAEGLGKAAAAVRCAGAVCFKHTPVTLSQKVGKVFGNVSKSFKKGFSFKYGPEVRFEAKQTEKNLQKTGKKINNLESQLDKTRQKHARLSAKKEKISSSQSSYPDPNGGHSHMSSVRQSGPNSGQSHRSSGYDGQSIGGSRRGSSHGQQGGNEGGSHHGSRNSQSPLFDEDINQHYPSSARRGSRDGSHHSSLHSSSAHY